MENRSPATPFSDPFWRFHRLPFFLASDRFRLPDGFEFLVQSPTIPTMENANVECNSDNGKRQNSEMKNARIEMAQRPERGCSRNTHSTVCVARLPFPN
eukprot:1195761-Prorocentrum_minimum.AAC.8